MISATWNIHAFIDNQDNKEPEGRTAIISRELVRYNIDPAALSRTRLLDEGQLREECRGYTFWKGRLAQDRCVHGIGFTIKNKLIRG
ncbi:hypothetical protein Y1Q_0022835 [Alligator mississippiensis]|uniref:Uncharacterized protein n=1 Tax=Alligator mississippiensis TaxID=8496 RepID=A0A151N4Q0_ALLMI|nr:hypothetical protein Y1Q_0022835 [Alligator mississippiensis]